MLNTLNFLAFFVLIDFRNGGFWPTKSEHLHINTIVCFRWESCINWWIPNFFSAKTEDIAHELMVRVFTMFCNSEHVESEYFLSSLAVWFWFSSSSFLLAWREFSCRFTWWSPISEWELGSTSCLDARSISFLSSAYPGLTRYPKLLWRDFLTPGIPYHQRWLRYRRGRAFIRHRLLNAFRHGALLSNLIGIVGKKIAKKATSIHREIHNVERTKKVIPFISWETSSGQNVSELVSGVHILDLDFAFQIDSFEQQIKSNSVGSGHSFIIFKDVQLRLTLRKMFVSVYVIHIRQLNKLLLSFVSWCFGFGMKSISFSYARTFVLDIVVGWSWYINHYVANIKSK